MIQPTPDVVVMIHPLSPDVTAIGVAYSKRVTHRRVQADIDRLKAATGWKQAAPLIITNESADPTRPAVPVTTAARLIVSGAPQVIKNSPILTPYISAFQTFRYLELVFILPELNPYQGVDQYKTPALSVNLIKDEGVYRYEVEIQDHKKPVPWLKGTARELPAKSVASTPASNKTESASNVTYTAPGRIWLASLLLISGTVLLAGLGIYSFRHRSAAPPL